MSLATGSESPHCCQDSARLAGAKRTSAEPCLRRVGPGRTIMKTLTRASILSLAVMVVAPAAWSAESVRVTGDHVNLRAAANTSSRVIAVVDRGKVLDVLGREGSWIRVTAPGGGAGYISSTLCEPVPSATPAPSQPVAATPPPQPPSRSSGRSGGSSKDPLRV